MLKISIIQNPGPEEYESQSIASSLMRRGADVNVTTASGVASLPDIALIRNTKGADYKYLKALEHAGVRFINKLETHYLVSDKWLKYDRLMKADMRVPKTLLIPIPFDDYHPEQIGDELGYPCVLKRRYGAYGIGVELCQSETHLYSIAKKFAKEFNDTTMLAQKYINYSPDYMSLGWVNGEMRAHVAKAPNGDNSFLSYKKPEHLSSRKPYPINSQLRDIVTSALKHVEIELARVDILFNNDGYVICEINSPGGFRGFEKVHSIDMGDIIASYIMGSAK
jgi:gamma-F420-2:alpha-L-glutamate ligase